MHAIPRSVTVVGASLAGITLVQQLRALGYDGAIEVIGAETQLPYARPPLSKQVLEGTWPAERTRILEADALEALGVRVRMGECATGLRAWERRLCVGRRWQDYDALVIATGLRARQVEGLKHLRVLRTLTDAVQLREQMGLTDTMAVVGAGVLGQEIASAARARGLEVTLIGRAATLDLGALGALVSGRLEALHREHGVQLRLGRTVRAIRPDAIVLDDGSTVRASLQVAALGGVPEVGWMDGSGVVIDDGVVCDGYGRAAEGVHAIGDVARWCSAGAPHRRAETQSTALDQAALVAQTLATGSCDTPAVPYAWTQLHGVRIQVHGTVPHHARLISNDPAGSISTVTSADTEDTRVTAVIGWNAGRDFREARSLVHHPEAVSPPAPGTPLVPIS